MSLPAVAAHAVAPSVAAVVACRRRSRVALALLLASATGLWVHIRRQQPGTPPAKKTRRTGVRDENDGEGLHHPSPPLAGDRSELKAWYHLTLTIVRGAAVEGLRRWLCFSAFKHVAFLGSIEYSKSPLTGLISGSSDLCAELYFKSETQAYGLVVSTVDALRIKWGITDEARVLFHVEETQSSEDHPLLLPGRYLSNESPVDRSNFEAEERTESTPKTTVTDRDEIEAESIVAWEGAELQFERCHIDASIKSKPGKRSVEDTTGNWIPLPAHWHDFYHADTISNTPRVSIAAFSLQEDYDQQGRQAVLVDVYLSPQLEARWRDLLVAQLKHPEQLYDENSKPRSVWRVQVYKMEAEKFMRLLNQQHNKKVSQWSSVP